MLPYIGLGVGLSLLGLGLWSLTGPASFRRTLAAFPRHRISAILLTVVNALWVAWLIEQTPLGRFEGWKTLAFGELSIPTLWVLTPLSIWLVIQFMDELLAPRMLGALFLLAAAPALDAARWHPSPWRLVLTSLVYILIVWGVVLLLSPYRFRHSMDALWTGGRRIWSSIVVMGLGAWLIFLSLTVYPT